MTKVVAQIPDDKWLRDDGADFRAAVVAATKRLRRRLTDKEREALRP